MTDIDHVRGDKLAQKIKFQFSITGLPVVLTAPVVIKIGAKQKGALGAPNADGLFFLQTAAGSVLITDAAQGEAIFTLEKGDTIEGKPGPYCWETELTRSEGLSTNAGTIAVVNGSGIMTGTGLDLSSIKIGDILLPFGAAAQNQAPVVVSEIEGSAGAGNLMTDYTGWNVEAGVAIEIHDGDPKTVPGVGGIFTLLPDVVS